jgi:hypothetical protein
MEREREINIILHGLAFLINTMIEFTHCYACGLVRLHLFEIVTGTVHSLCRLCPDQVRCHIDDSSRGQARCHMDHSSRGQARCQ